jgi:hypothetical protein
VAGLPQVARKAATDDVIPFMSTPSALGKDVVEGDVLGFTSAVLTGVFVAIEYLEAREALLQARALHELGEADYRRNGDRGGYGVQLAAAVLDYFCFAVEDQYHGSANPAYVEWFEVLVQDQHRDIGQIYWYHSSFRMLFRPIRGEAALARQPYPRLRTEAFRD